MKFFKGRTKIWIYTLCLILSGFTHQDSKAQDAIPTQDGTFVKMNTAPTKFTPLFNLIASSISYGLGVNQIINGSGNKAMINPTQSESAVKQVFRQLSLMDLYFTHGMKKLENGPLNGEHVVFLRTPADNQTITQSKDLSHPMINNLLDFLHFYFPLLPKQSLKVFYPHDIEIRDKEIVFSNHLQKKFANALRTRLKTKWTNLWKNPKPFDVLSSQSPMAEARKAIELGNFFTPLATLFELFIDKKKGSYLSFKVFLQGFPGINRVDPKDPRTWELTPFIEEALPEPMPTDTAIMTHVNYMTNVPKEKRKEELEKRVIILEIKKHFNEKDDLRVALKFGKIPDEVNNDPSKAKKRKGLFSWLKGIIKKKENIQRELRLAPLDNTTQEASLGLRGYAQSAMIDANSKINKYMNKFTVKVFIHELHFSFKRSPTNSFQESFDQNLTFRPVFDPKRSRFSYRMIKGSNKKAHNFLLGKIMGFKCRDTVPSDKMNYKKICQQDFSTMKEFYGEFVNKITKDAHKPIFRTITDGSISASFQDLENLNIQKELEKAAPEQLYKFLMELKKYYGSFYSLGGTVLN